MPLAPVVWSSFTVTYCSGLWLLLSFPAGVSLPDSWHACCRDHCSKEPHVKDLIHSLVWSPTSPCLFQQTDQPVSAWHDWRTSYQHQEAYQLQNDSECQPLMCRESPVHHGKNMSMQSLKSYMYECEAPGQQYCQIEFDIMSNVISCRELKQTIAVATV